MNFHEIFTELCVIEEGLAYGQVGFSYDKLMCAMKPGHPADLLCDILSPISMDAFLDKEIPLDKLKTLQRDLKSFRSAFKVKELAAPIKHLGEYIKEQENKEA